jgi:hypothetical protein
LKLIADISRQKMTDLSHALTMLRGACQIGTERLDFPT